MRVGCMALQQKPCSRRGVAKQLDNKENRHTYRRRNRNTVRNQQGISKGPAQATIVTVVRARDKANVRTERLQCCRGSPRHWLQESSINEVKA